MHLGRGTSWHVFIKPRLLDIVDAGFARDTQSCTLFRNEKASGLRACNLDLYWGPRYAHSECYSSQVAELSSPTKESLLIRAEAVKVGSGNPWRSLHKDTKGINQQYMGLSQGRRCFGNLYLGISRANLPSLDLVCIS